MAQDPRKYLAFKSVDCNTKNQNINSDKFTVFDAVQKISDVEINSSVLNRTRELVRFGNTANSDTLIGDGVAQIFGVLGFNYELTNSTVRNFNSDVANRAIGAAERIAEDIRNGNFSEQSVTDSLSDFQNLEALTSGIYTPTTVNKKSVEVCYPSHYAQDLINYAPKYKFLFVTEFVMKQGYEGMLTGIKPAALCYQFQRPNPTFEYEDINMYGYRTKATKHITWPPAQMTLYDDLKNNVMEFFTRYLKAVSPIANLQNGEAYEDAQFNFGEASHSSSIKTPDKTLVTANPGGGSSEREIIAKNIISEIRVFHIFNNGQYYNNYRFFNPRINEIQFDELTMEASETNTLTIDFNYDHLYIDTGLSMAYNDEQVRDASELEKYPIRYTGTKSTSAQEFDYDEDL